VIRIAPFAACVGGFAAQAAHNSSVLLHLNRATAPARFMHSLYVGQSSSSSSIYLCVPSQLLTSCFPVLLCCWCVVCRPLH
jgi:hypothetical protein